MKNSLGSLLAMATMVAYSSAYNNCTQPLEITTHHHKVLVHKYRCNQEVHHADLQKEPEIFYDAPLPHNNNYTLLLLEKNNNTESYKIHWFLTDIIPVNKSLTANKTVVEAYKPPMNNMTTTYTVLLYRHPNSLHLKSPSHTEMEYFIPNSWIAPIGPIHNITLENNATFHVTGRNTSHVHPSGGIHPPIPTHEPTYHTQSTSPPIPQAPKTTVKPQYNIHTVTEKGPGYNFYNSTNSSSTNHNTPSRKHKNGASSNVGSITVLFIPLVLVITKVIY